MEDIIDKFRQLDPKKKLIIIASFVALIVIIPLALMLIDSQQKQNVINEIRESSEQYRPAEELSPTNIIGRMLSGGSSEEVEGIDVSGSDVEVLARSGDWVAVRVISLQMSSYGDQSYAIYQKEDGEYKLKAGGSIVNQDDYDDLSIPQEIFDAISDNTTQKSDSKLQAILVSSPNKTWPIINSLPMGNDYYKVTYGFNDQSDVNSFYIYINAQYGYNNAAVNNIINAGFDPGDYKIVFNYDIVKRMSGNENE